MGRNEDVLTSNPNQQVNAVNGMGRLGQVGLVLGFLLICGFNLIHHSLWRDEMQAWLFARDSGSIPELLRNLRYETHPRLWYLILFVLSRFTRDPAAIQITNFVIICAAIAVFVRYCPLPLYLKALTVFGSYFVFDWGTFSRNYSLGVLFCFAFCAWFPKRGKGYLPLAIMLFLAIQSNISAATISVALAGLLVLEAWRDPAVRARISSHRIDAVSSVLQVLGGAALALWTAVPQPDAYPANKILDGTVTIGHRLMNAFSALCEGFIPWLGDSMGKVVFGTLTSRAIAGMILFVLTVAFFRRTRLIWWTYLSGAVLLLLFAFVKLDMEARHKGHFFLWFIICIWLAYLLPESDDSNGSRSFKLSTYQTAFFCLFLIIQICDAAAYSTMAVRTPFSVAKEAALYIEQNHLRTLPILGYPDYLAMPVAGYLDERIYYPDSDRWGTFFIEDNKRHIDWSGFEVMEAINRFAAQGHQDFLVLLAYPLVAQMKGQKFEVKQIGNLRRIAAIYPAITDEIYFIYRYTATNNANPLEHYNGQK